MYNGQIKYKFTTPIFDSRFRTHVNNIINCMFRSIE